MQVQVCCLLICTVCHSHFIMAVSVFAHHIHLCGGLVTMCLVTSVLAHHTIYVVVLDCIPVADVGVPPVCPCRPLLHHGDGAGVNAG